VWNLYSQVFFCHGASAKGGSRGGAGVQRHESGTNSLVAFKQNHTAALVTRCKIVARVIELDSRDDIGWGRLQSVQRQGKWAISQQRCRMTGGKSSNAGVLLPYLL